MAFKIGNRTVLNDSDPSAVLQANSNLDSLQINSTDVLVHDGSTITLKNVNIGSGVNLGSATINSDNITEGTTNLFFTDARAQSALATTVTSLTSSINANTANIATNTADIATNTTAIATNATAITTGDASTLTTANAYTDTREVAITTAYTAAIASSTSSGTASANAYTDSEIATATTDITTAYTSADQIILATAKSYTDTREVAITSAYQTYADQAETDAKAYTDTEIANLVDSAPTTLDTLNELASALGDDANFSTTVTNSIATKLPLAGGTLTGDLTLSGAPTNALHATTKAYVDSAVSSGTGALDTDSIPEGSSNLYYTDARADARATLRINAATTDNIDEGSSNLYFTNARARTEIEGADLDLGTNKILYSNVYNNLSDLPSAASYHGMFAHVHSTGRGYFAHASNWVPLANSSEITTYTAGNGLSLSGSNEFTMSGSYTGDFTATGDVTAYSDKRLKRNIETITNAVDTVSKLRGVNYEKDGRNSTGVIAQEVEEVLPQVVHTAPDGMKSVAYGNIVGILIEAIKEQQKEIEELKKKL